MNVAHIPVDVIAAIDPNVSNIFMMTVMFSDGTWSFSKVPYKDVYTNCTAVKGLYL